MTSGNETGLNIEYWFRIIYECVIGGCGTHADWLTYLVSVWMWITWLGYIFAVLGLIFIVYAMVKLFDLRHREEEQLGELIVSEESGGQNKRWEHIASLIESGKVSDWRQAIIEADIVLDEMLTKQGYSGDGIGEKLKKVEPSDFNTLQDAWEAHKVRNQIAHEGSNFDLSETLARRTLARYEAVFREFGFI
jgi:hypothetical protein